MGYVETTAPTVEPLTPEEVRDVIKYADDAEDKRIRSLIKSVRLLCEHETDCALINRTITWTPSAFCSVMSPVGDSRARSQPMNSVTSIKYYDSTPTLQTVTASDYEVVTSGRIGKIMIADGASWPTGLDVRAEPIEILLVAGYGATSASVPEPLRVAMLDHIKWIFDGGYGEFPPHIMQVYFNHSLGIYR